jgi:acyl carrier protein
MIIQNLRATPIDVRRTLLEDFVQSQVALVLGHQTRAVPRTQGFADLGMDSLAAIELRTRLQQALNCSLPTTLAFDYPTVESLLTFLWEDILTSDFHQVVPWRDGGADSTDGLGDLSRDDIARLLARELNTQLDGKNP